jgi:hypothetical protein
MPKTTLQRREFLRGTGVALALPLLEAMRLPVSAAPAMKRKRMVAIMTPLGIHGENLFPTEAGRSYQATPYLQPLQALRRDFTVFSGVSHPDVDGGHDSERSFLTAAPHPGASSFRNTVSLDQLAAEQIGAETRYASLVLSTMGGSISWTRGGVNIPSESRPSRLFAKLFLEGSAKEVQQQMAKLKEGQSVMDMVSGEAKRMARDLSQHDQDKLDEYFTSVRELEARLHKGEEWATKAKPKVTMKPPTDIMDNADLIARTALMYDLAHLALQTDSTRLITLHIQGTGLVPPIKGVTMEQHNLSHHGKDPEKLKQLGLLEAAQMVALAGFLAKLKQSQEDSSNLLDQTMVLYGSNLGNASSHDTKNMPIVLAGGGFQHGQHLAFDTKQNEALPNLYVMMLQQLGLEVDAFATSTKSGLRGFTS